MAQQRKHPQNYVTLKNVAEYAGVSTKTVSRVVNDQGEISEATRERVQAAIKKLGYQPNMLARSLVNGQTKTLAAVVWGIVWAVPEVGGNRAPFQTKSVEAIAADCLYEHETQAGTGCGGD